MINALGRPLRTSGRLPQSAMGSELQPTSMHPRQSKDSTNRFNLDEGIAQYIDTLATSSKAQQLLFDKSCPPPRRTDIDVIPETFYDSGSAIFCDVKSPRDAYSLLEGFVANINVSRLPHLAPFESSLQLAKADAIPVCNDVVQTSFQPLHFDMGHPFALVGTQSMYLIAALYCPLQTTEITATTRVVNVRDLLRQRPWGGAREINQRLAGYVSAFGDGWSLPEKVNTFRLACFARVIDAASRREEFTSCVNLTMGEWFQDGKPLDWRIGLSNEYSYYARCGLDLSSVEKHVKLKPGQLLVLDNIRTIHGRFGKRKPKEVYQFLYGIKSVDEQQINAFTDYLVSCFA